MNIFFYIKKNILHISKKQTHSCLYGNIRQNKKIGTEARLEIVKRKRSDNQTYVSYHVSIFSYILEAEKLQTYESILFLTLNLREAKVQTKKKNKKKSIPNELKYSGIRNLNRLTVRFSVAYFT